MAENEKLKCALYFRTSTEDQKEKNTIAAQKAELPIFVEKMGWQITGEYVDEGISGSFVEGREDFLRLLTDAAKKKFDILVVSEFSRITRSVDPVERAMIVKTLQDHSIKIASPNDGLQSVKTLDDELMVYLRQWQSAKEGKAIAQRMKRGKRQKLRNGQYCLPSVPLGLKRRSEGQGKDKKHFVEINPEEEKILRQIYKWIVHENKSITDCCHILNKRAEEKKGPWTRKGRRWHPASMSAILRKEEGLTGTIVCNKKKVKSVGSRNGKLIFKTLPDRPEDEWIRVKVPALFTKQEYSRLQEKIQSNRIDMLIDKEKDLFLLRHMVRCGICGRMCSCVTAGSPGYKKSRYYTCGGRLLRKKVAGDQRCEQGPYVRAENLESAVMNNLVAGLLKSPKKVLKLWGQVRHRKTEIDQVKKKIEGVEKAILEKENQRKKLVKLYLTTKELPQQELDEQAGQINFEIEELEKEKAKYEAELDELKRLQGNVKIVEESLAMFKSFGNKLIKKIDAMEFEDKRRLISHFLQGEGFVEISKDFDKWARPEYGYKEVKNLPRVRDNLKTRGLLFPWFEFKGKIDIAHVINILKDFNDQGKVPHYYKDTKYSVNPTSPE